MSVHISSLVHFQLVIIPVNKINGRLFVSNQKPIIKNTQNHVDLTKN